eukprot:506663_1
MALHLALIDEILHIFTSLNLFKHDDDVDAETNNMYTQPIIQHSNTHDFDLWLAEHKLCRSEKTTKNIKKSGRMRIDIRKQTQTIVANSWYIVNNKKINLATNCIQIKLFPIKNKENKSSRSQFDKSKITVLKEADILDVALNFHKQNKSYLIGIIVMRSESEIGGKREKDGTFEANLFRRSTICKVNEEWKKINNFDCSYIALVSNCEIFRQSEKIGYKLIENECDICKVLLVGVSKSKGKLNHKQNRIACKNRLVNGIQLLINQKVNIIIMQQYGSSRKDKNSVDNIVSFTHEIINSKYIIYEKYKMPELIVVCKDSAFDCLMRCIQ